VLQSISLNQHDKLACWLAYQPNVPCVAQTSHQLAIAMYSSINRVMKLQRRIYIVGGGGACAPYHHSRDPASLICRCMCVPVILAAMMMYVITNCAASWLSSFSNMHLFLVDARF
jgi:hypothetical protein